jgi:hypothetical protein
MYKVAVETLDEMLRFVNNSAYWTELNGEFFCRNHKGECLVLFYVGNEIAA